MAAKTDLQRIEMSGSNKKTIKMISSAFSQKDWQKKFWNH